MAASAGESGRVERNGALLAKLKAVAYDMDLHVGAQAGRIYASRSANFDADAEKWALLQRDPMVVISLADLVDLLEVPR